MGDKKVSNAPPPITPIRGVGHFPPPRTIASADYKKWLKADLWTIERAILLLLGVDELPLRDQNNGRCKSEKEQEIYDKFMDIWDVAKSSLIAGTLKQRGKSFPDFWNLVKPIDFLSWTIFKGYQIPDEIRSLAITGPFEQESQNNGQETIKKIRNERDLTKWMRETWIREGKPKGSAFFDALKKYTDTTKYPDSPIRAHFTTGPKGAGIRWTTGNATNYMTKKNIQTMASRFKSECP